MLDVSNGGKWCIILDNCYYKFFEDYQKLQEYITVCDSVEDHEMVIKAMPF